MKRILGTALMAATFAAASQALAEDWVCTFPNQQVDGWLRGQVFLTIDGENATVFDSLINEVHGGPIPGRISANNDKRLTVKWDLRRVELRHGYAPRIFYTLSYIKNNNRANFTALASELDDYRNSDRAGGNFGASGSCKKR